MADHMRTSLLFEALEMALGRQILGEGGLLTHSDRGTQLRFNRSSRVLKQK